MQRQHPDAESANFWRSPGRAVLDVFLVDQAHATSTWRKTSRAATPAVHRPGASAPATKQAAGAPSARSQPYPSPSRGRADGATLGRPRHEPRRTRRPAFRDVRVPAATRYSNQRQRRLQRSAVIRQRTAINDRLAGAGHRHRCCLLEHCSWSPPSGSTEPDRRSGIRFQGQDEAPHGDP